MEKLIYVGIGGFVGASLRYLISIFSAKIFNGHLPYGTLIVNIMGGLLIGLIMEMSGTTKMISPNLRLFLTTGMLGGLTTFSTFSYETVILFMNTYYLWGMINICLNLFLSLAGVIVGRMIVQMF
ncbi:fluoride efflux transporter CrcB [Clostridiaceae bacterium 35-E11]